MLKKHIILSLFICAVSFRGYSQAPTVSPYQMGAYVPGITNPGDYANPGMTGLLVVDYNIFFSSDKFIDENGSEVDNITLPGGDSRPLSVDLSGYINSLLLTYVSPELSFLGNARYFGFIAPSYFTSSMQVGLSELVIEDVVVNGGVGGFGDLNIAPLFLTWTSKNSKVDLTGGYMFTAPTGRYTTGAEDNVGIGFWSHDFQLFTYYYLNERATTLYVGQTFETHSKLKDADVKPGNRYIIEYGISQYVSERLDLTMQGSTTRQVSKDTGNDVIWDNSYKDKYSTIGAGAGYWVVPGVFYTNLKWWTNYNIREHFKFNSFQVQLLYIPNLGKK